MSYGVLTPLPAGDPVPLLKKRLRIGRRDGCDIILNFSNISGHHALMEIDGGYWFVRDLRSRNGVKLDDNKIPSGLRKRLDPEVIVAFASHEFIIRYDPVELGAYGTPPQDEIIDDIFRKNLQDRAGTGVRPRNSPKDYPPMGGHARPED